MLNTKERYIRPAVISKVSVSMQMFLAGSDAETDVENAEGSITGDDTLPEDVKGQSMFDGGGFSSESWE